MDLAERMLVDFRAMADEGRCLPIISHDADLISAVADRVLILNGGRGIAEMPAAEFMDPDHHDHGRYAAGLWRAAERLRRRRPVTGRRGPPDRGRGGRSC